MSQAMALWKIVPVAGKGDPRWLDHPIWAEVVVRAPTAAQARVLAAEMERREAGDAAPAGNESLSFTGGFEDEKLYRVMRLGPEEAPDFGPEGPEAVLRARRLRDEAIEASRPDGSFLPATGTDRH